MLLRLNRCPMIGRLPRSGTSVTSTRCCDTMIPPITIAVLPLENLNRERRTLVSSVVPSVVSIKTSKKVAVRKYLDPGDFFNRGPRQYRNPNEEAMVQNSLGSGVIVSEEGHIITNNHVVDQVDEIEVQLSDGKTKKAKLIGADARLRVADRFAGPIDESPYFGNYERQRVPWRLTVAEVDGELAIVVLRPHGDEWKPDSVARLEVIDQHIVRIVDYAHCPWVLPAATSVVVADRC